VPRRAVSIESDPIGSARSGYVSAKTPSDWIVLQPTADADVVQAETGRFLFARKSFRVNLRTGEVNGFN
jgi:hypothetical protein